MSKKSLPCVGASLISKRCTASSSIRFRPQTVFSCCLMVSAVVDSERSIGELCHGGSFKASKTESRLSDPSSWVAKIEGGMSFDFQKIDV